MGSIPGKFHIMANANGWGDSEKAYYLSTSTDYRRPSTFHAGKSVGRGQDGFSEACCRLGESLWSKTSATAEPSAPEHNEAQKSEPLQELVENIERRVRLTYPEATGDVQEALTMHHLTTAVDERMQAELLRRKPRRLQDALEVLTTEEAIRDCNRYQDTAPVREVSAREEEAQQQHTTSDDAFNAAVMKLTEAIQSQQVKPRADQADSPRRTSFTGDCWYCLKKGHMKRDCRKWKYEKAGETKNKRGNGDVVFRRSNKPCTKAEEKQDHSNECRVRRIALKPDDRSNRSPEDLQPNERRVQRTTLKPDERSNRSPEGLQREQRNDPSLGIIINWLENRPIRPSWREVSPQSLEVKRYWRLWESLSIQDGILTYRWETAN